MKRYVIWAITFLLTAALLAGCRTPAKEGVTAPSVSTSTESTGTSLTTSSTESTGTPTPPRQLIEAFQTYLEDKHRNGGDTSCDAGYYLADYVLVVCATDQATLDEYRTVLEPLGTPECVRYEQTTFSLGYLKRVSARLKARMSELHIDSLAIDQQKNHVLVTVSREDWIAAIKDAAGEDADALDFLVATTIDA